MDGCVSGELSLPLFETHASDQDFTARRHLAELLGHDVLLAGRGLLELDFNLGEFLATVPSSLDFLHPVADAAHANGVLSVCRGESRSLENGGNRVKAGWGRRGETGLASQTPVWLPLGPR